MTMMIIVSSFLISFSGYLLFKDFCKTLPDGKLPELEFYDEVSSLYNCSIDLNTSMLTVDAIFMISCC